MPDAEKTADLKMPAPADDYLCDMCSAPMQELIGPATWQDTTRCPVCGFSPDDAWRCG